MSTSPYTIAPVASNAEKQQVYRMHMGRYKRAKEAGYYLECLWVLYAMLEDRSSAFLYYAGFTKEDNRRSVTASRSIKQQVCTILGLPVQGKYVYGFNTLAGKQKRIEQVLDWSLAPCEGGTAYQLALQKALAPFAARQDLRGQLAYLCQEWREKRNQLIHAMFNKGYASADAELSALAESGHDAIRALDNAVSCLKKARLRQRFKIK